MACPSGGEIKKFTCSLKIEARSYLLGEKKSFDFQKFTLIPPLASSLVSNFFDVFVRIHGPLHV